MKTTKIFWGDDNTVIVQYGTPGNSGGARPGAGRPPEEHTIENHGFGSGMRRDPKAESEHRAIENDYSHRLDGKIKDHQIAKNLLNHMHKQELQEAPALKKFGLIKKQQEEMSKLEDSHAKEIKDLEVSRDKEHRAIDPTYLPVKLQPKAQYEENVPTYRQLRNQHLNSENVEGHMTRIKSNLLNWRKSNE